MRGGFFFYYLGHIYNPYLLYRILIMLSCDVMVFLAPLFPIGYTEFGLCLITVLRILVSDQHLLSDQQFVDISFLPPKLFITRQDLARNNLSYNHLVVLTLGLNGVKLFIPPFGVKFYCGI